MTVKPVRCPPKRTNGRTPTRLLNAPGLHPQLVHASTQLVILIANSAPTSDQYRKPNTAITIDVATPAAIDTTAITAVALKRIWRRNNAWCCTVKPPKMKLADSTRVIQSNLGSWKNQAMKGERIATTNVTPTLNAQLIQNKAETWLCVIWPRWIVAFERPRSLNIPMKPVTEATIAIRPKSRGNRSRPRIAADSNCRTSFI